MKKLIKFVVKSVRNRICRKVKGELSAYLDKEIKDKRRQFISEHLKSCSECKKEFNILAKRDEYLRQLERVVSSSNFIEKFWQKVSDNEREKIKIKTKGQIPRIKWAPIPVMIILLSVLFYNLFSFSFVLSASGKDLQNRILCNVMEELVVHYNPVNPVSFLRLCKSCEECLHDKTDMRDKEFSCKEPSCEQK